MILEIGYVLEIFGKYVENVKDDLSEDIKEKIKSGVTSLFQTYTISVIENEIFFLSSDDQVSHSHLTS